jgi:hypothetical protein
MSCAGKWFLLFLAFKLMFMRQFRRLLARIALLPLAIVLAGLMATSYIDIAGERVASLRADTLRLRPMNRPVYEPPPRDSE